MHTSHYLADLHTALDLACCFLQLAIQARRYRQKCPKEPSSEQR